MVLGQRGDDRVPVPSPSGAALRSLSFGSFLHGAGRGPQVVNRPLALAGDLRLDGAKILPHVVAGRGVEPKIPHQVYCRLVRFNRFEQPDSYGKGQVVVASPTGAVPPGEAPAVEVDGLGSL